MSPHNLNTQMPSLGNPAFSAQPKRPAAVAHGDTVRSTVWVRGGTV